MEEILRIGVAVRGRGAYDRSHDPNEKNSLTHARTTMPRQTKMTAERKAKFLEHLRKHGLVIMAAKHATPTSPLGAKVSFYAERERDPEFAAAWDEAIDESEEEVMRELKRRGIEGYEEDVYGSLGNNQGTGVVGRRVVFSDKLAELWARVHSMRVRQGLTNKVEMSGSLETGPIGLDKLTPKQQELLQQLLDEAE